MHNNIAGATICAGSTETPLSERMPDDQRGKLFSAMNELVGRGVSRAQRLHFATAVLGRPVRSFTTLTAAEGSVLIDHLERSLTLLAV